MIKYCIQLLILWQYHDTFFLMIPSSNRISLFFFLFHAKYMFFTAYFVSFWAKYEQFSLIIQFLSRILHKFDANPITSLPTINECSIISVYIMMAWSFPATSNYKWFCYMRYLPWCWNQNKRNAFFYKAIYAYSTSIKLTFKVPITTTADKILNCFCFFICWENLRFILHVNHMHSRHFRWAVRPYFMKTKKKTTKKQKKQTNKLLLVTVLNGILRDKHTIIIVNIP